jgi:signal transduction histidine kinase
LERTSYLFEGLTVRRVIAVTVICVVAALGVRWFFTNTLVDLLLIAICIGYSSMLFFTLATNLRMDGMRREARQILAIVIGSFLGTILAGLLRGLQLSNMLTERLWGVSMTMGLGIGVGCVVMAAAIIRERQARDEARLHRAEAERQQLEKNILEAKLQLMQAQVEPHFLFNTLANVQHLVETDPPAASRMLDSLIHYLRAALPQMREATTTLGREVDMARAFLEIHRVRMGSRLDYHIDVPTALACAPFPPMMLISLVENAIKHGVDPCCDSGSITLHASERDGRLIVSVIDTGEGIVAKQGGGVGLTNIRERLKALYGSDARLLLAENSPHGVVATLEVPASRAVDVIPGEPRQARAA